jgi:DNA-binding transcriptional MerR regulator
VRGPQKKKLLTLELVPHSILAAMTKSASQSEFLSSGELARLAGVSSDTLRHYERKGVLPRPKRLPNGYRAYPVGASDRIRLVRRALSVGFTLDELAEFLRARDGGNPPCRRVRALAAQKLADVEMQLVELTALRDQLGQLIEEWDRLLSASVTNEKAGLLESLSTKSPGRNDSGRSFKRQFHSSQRKAIK